MQSPSTRHSISGTSQVEPSVEARNVPRRGTKACIICNKRKIKCNLSEGIRPCENCSAFGYECVPRERKRRRYTVVSERDSEDPETFRLRAVSAAKSPVIPVEAPQGQTQAHYDVVTPRETAEFFTAALTSQFATNGPPQPAVAHATASPSVPIAEQSSFLHTSPGGASTVASASARGYLGRSVYLGDELQDHEDSAAQDNADIPHKYLTVDDLKVLNLRRAFDLPSRAVCESLVATFVAKCHPWMPVVDDETLHRLQNGDMSSTPLLLLQAILMAGSRMQRSTSALEQTSTQDYYNRAKVIFFSNYEQDTMTLVKAVTILQYWNPTGPEHVSIHNSSYWMRIGVGLAFQIGLHRAPDPTLPDYQIRRRVFWSLFARDSLLSAGQGRPRAIHLEDCTTDWPILSDFPAQDKRAHLFIAYVRISGILGDLTQWYLRGCHSPEARLTGFESQLKSWIHELPECLGMRDTAGRTLPYDSEARQLYLIYFTAISILYRPHLPSKSSRHSQATIGSTIASSCAARIFEDSLARGDVRDGVAMHAIYALIAGIGALSNYDYPLLWSISQTELKITTLFLTELSKTWQTAKGTLKILTHLQETVSQFKNPTSPPPLEINNLDLSLFEPFGPDFCLKWPVIVKEGMSNPTYRDNTAMKSTATIRAETGTLNGSVQENSWTGVADADAEISPGAGMASMFEGIPGDSLYSYGNWFLEDNFL